MVPSSLRYRGGRGRAGEPPELNPAVPDRRGQATPPVGDGRRYEGGWQGGKRHGRGVMTWPNGDVYAGEWRDDKTAPGGALDEADSATASGTVTLH